MTRGKPLGTWRARIGAVLVLALGSVGLGLYALAAQGLAAPSITAKPANPTNQTSASFTYTHQKSISSFQCSLDGSAFAGCGTSRPSTKVYPGPLAPGAHTFQVRAIMGIQTSPAAVFTWTIDTTAPNVVSIDRNGPTPSNASSVSWNVTFSEAVTGVGMDDFVRVASGLVSSGLTSVSGSGAAYVVAANTGSGSGTIGLNLVDNDSIKDPAGNKLGGTGLGNGSFTGQVYAIDKVDPPQPVFTQTPTDPSPTADTTFAWTDTEAGVAFQCSVENGLWFSCSSPHNYEVEVTNNEQHQFAVRAVDAAGNVSAAAGYSWKVQKIDFTITGAVGLLYPGTWRSIDVSITNPNSYDIALTSLDVSVSSSPPGCSAATNIEFEQSPLSASNTFTVARNSTATLPAAFQPRIRLVNLPYSQDACKNGTFDLFYGGTGTK